MSALTDLVTKAREGARGAFARPAGYLAGEWERRAPRERRLIAIGSAVALGAATILGTYLLFSSVSDLQDDNAAMRDALTAIAKHRDEYLDAKARGTAQEQRIGNDPPQLTADIEGAAHDENIQIAESSERPVSPAGRRYVEHDLDIKIREVDLQSLTKFLRRLETGPRLIFFTRLSIKKRFSENDKLDVEATATAFERVHEEKTKKKPGAAEAKEPSP
jgi:type II secretory pathway component PulM